MRPPTLRPNFLHFSFLLDACLSGILTSFYQNYTEVTNLKLPEYAAGVVNRLNEASKLVRSHLQAAAQTSSRWYNNKAKVKTFKPGDIVRIYYPRRYVGRSPKWQSYYSTVGQVVERLNDVTYLVASKQWKKNKVIHVDKIKNVIFFPSC